VRLFVAVLLTEATRGALAAEIDRLRQAGRGVSWVGVDNLHVTLKFLGEVDATTAAAVRDALAGSVAEIGRFALEIRGLGAFPSPNRPRVIWAGIGDGADHLRHLAERVDAALAAVGFPAEDRPFTGHVTLGRVREPRRDLALAEALSASAGRLFGLVPVDRIVLVQSQLSPKGARYTPLDASPLRG
jgi:2'-5' RNA ligase